MVVLSSKNNSFMNIAATLLLFTFAVVVLGAFYKPINWVSGHSFILLQYDSWISLSLVTSMFFLLILALPVSTEEKSLLIDGWFIKALVSLFAIHFYENRYGFKLDSFFYFQRAVNGSQTTISDVLNSGTDVTVFLSQFFLRFIPKTSEALRLCFSFVGLMGVLFFARAANIASHRSKRMLFYVFLLWPGLLFWGSTIGKEPLFIFTAGIFAYGSALLVANRKSPVGYLVAISGLLLSSLIRPWLTIIFGVPLLGVIYWGLHSNLSPLVTRSRATILVCGVVVFLAFLMYRIAYGYVPLSIVETVNNLTRMFKVGGSQTESPAIFATIGEVFAYFPTGALTALFRPFPGEVKSFFGALAGLESLLMLALSALILFRLKTKQLFSMAVWWPLSVVMVWATMYAFVSPHNLGTAVRYRMQAVPFLLITATLIEYPNWVEIKQMLKSFNWGRAKRKPRKVEFSK